ncbi:ParB/Srx family N-terminal domain-containing protein [Kitasatospora cheerisanensis]|uniref:ParB/Srx family N-terminal domain-containing protein n=1 Tax=Kitasatospora cheerisanensis TaxID=81942 RepID=UPI000564B23E|nr:ParB/Srx family N-terminal domain-containing protein [Kitasatospora cheerisanensis]
MAKKYRYELPEHPVDYGVKVAAADLKIEQEAQRTLNLARARAIAAEIKPHALGSIIVSQRSNGDLYIIDGQHRREACRIAGIDTLVAEVHRGLTIQEEATLFLIKNREASKTNAHDEYRIGLTAGLPLFVDTENVLVSHGLKIGSTSSNQIGAVQGILAITDKYGPDVLDDVLTVAEAAYGRTAEAWDGIVVGGLGEFLGRHRDVISGDADLDELARKLAKRSSAARLIGDARSQATGYGSKSDGTGSRKMAAYRLVIEAWNSGRRKNRIGAN